MQSSSSATTMESGSNTRHTRNWSNLSLELWVEIISYLPVLSLLRFRSVSKSFKSMVDDPKFVYLHLNRFRGNFFDPYLIIREEHTNRWMARCSNTFCEISDIEFPQSWSFVPRTPWEVSGTVNGLFLLQTMSDKWNAMLWNPSIHRCLLINPSKLYLRKINRLMPMEPRIDYSRIELCLGHDPSCNDYKVVVITHLTEVFSLKKRSWRIVYNNGYRLHCKIVGKRLTFGAYVHWVGKDCSTQGNPEFYLVSFNTTLEIFSYTPLPVDSKTMEPVMVDGSSVGLLTDTSIWLLEMPQAENPREVSFNWSMRYKINIFRLSRYGIYCFKHDGVLLHNRIDSSGGRYGLSSYDPRTDKSKVLSRSSSFYVSYMGTYVESLVLLKEGKAC